MMSRTIGVDIHSGLCNRLFQASMVYCVSRTFNTLFRLENLASHNIHTNNTYDFIWDRFKKQFNYNNEQVTYQFKLVEPPNYACMYMEFLPQIMMNHNESNLLWTGFFQDTTYFGNYIREVRHLIGEEPNYIKNYLDTVNIDLNNAMFIHFRLGDYINHPTHWLSNVEAFYIDSINDFIANQNGSPINFVIVSNEPANMWNIFAKVKELLKDANCNVYEVHDKDELISLYIMARCKKGGIMPNSSFSWWGAFLNDNDNKIIYMPKQWFNDNRECRLHFEDAKIWYGQNNTNNFKNVLNNKIIFDICANIGSWTLANKNYGNIVCVEASPDTFNKLVNNVRHFPNVRCLNYAVTNSKNDNIIFYECDNTCLSSTNIEWFGEKSRFHNEKYHPIKCKTISLDKLIQSFGIPELLKIDVEGSELDVIMSLTQKVPLLCFEWASEVNEHNFRCIDYLFNLGFLEFFIQMQDEYTFRPSVYYSHIEAKNILNNMIPKKDWGMIWCRSKKSLDDVNNYTDYINILFEADDLICCKKGIIHIGAHKCEELNSYLKYTSNILWIEANDELCINNPNIKNALISNVDDDEVDFIITNNGMSSSLLELHLHKTEHPNVVETKRIKKRTITLNTFFERNNLSYDAFDMLCLDIQGAEYLALLGASKILPNIKCIITEVNEKELYRNCRLINDLDKLLTSYNFKRIKTFMTQHGWGDAIYIRL